MSILTVSGDLVLGTEQTLVLDTIQPINTGPLVAWTVMCQAYPKRVGTVYIARKQNLPDPATFLFTPPIDYAQYNTAGTEVQVLYRVIAYEEDGTEHPYVADVYTYSIPESVKPEVELTVSDPTGYADVFGVYIQKKSKLQIETNTKIAYGSSVQSLSISADGNIYTEASVKTPVIESAASFDVAVTAIDGRGRSDTDSVTVTVLAYENPQISKLTVHRCNEDGAENDQGEYVKVTFSAEITSLGSQNTAAYAVKYKKATESTYTTGLSLDAESAGYAVADQVFIFPADSGSSYQVILEATDYFGTVSRSAPVSTAFTLINWHKSGLGLAFGKVAELAGYLEIALKTLFRKAAVFKNGVGLLWETASGEEREAMRMDEDGNMDVGKGGYDAAEGVTRIYGDSVEVFTNGGFTVNGEPVTAGVVTPVYFTLSVDEDGNLWAHYADESTTPEFEYDSETGNLYVIQKAEG